MKYFKPLLFAFTVILCSCGHKTGKLPPDSRASGPLPAATGSVTPKYRTPIPADSMKSAISRLLGDVNILSVHQPRGSANVWVLYTKRSTEKYLLTDTANFIAISNFSVCGKTLCAGAKKILSSEEWTNVVLDTVAGIKYFIINGKPYLYYSYYAEFQGNAIIDRDVYFNLVNLNSLQKYSLQYNGRTRNFNGKNLLEGDFVNAGGLNSFPAIRDKLLEYASKSVFLYHPRGAAKNIWHYSNYQKKWDIDNHADNHMSHGAGIIPDTIFSTLYRHSLFPLYRNDIQEPTLQFITSGQYYIYNETQGSILGYDVARKLYFPVYIESCIAMCSKTVSFVNSHTIAVSRDDGSPPIQIDLQKIVFTNQKAFK